MGRRPERELEQTRPRTVYSTWAFSIRPGSRGAAGDGGAWAIEEAPDEMAELAGWFVGLELPRLAHVWVSAVVFAHEFGTGYTTGDLARALNVVAERLNGFSLTDEEVQIMLAQKKTILSQAQAIPGTVTPIEGDGGGRGESSECEPHGEAPRSSPPGPPREAAGVHGLRPCGCVNRGRHRAGCAAAGSSPSAGTAPESIPGEIPASRRDAESAEGSAEPRTEAAKAYRLARDVLAAHAGFIEAQAWELAAAATKLRTEAAEVRKNARRFTDMLAELGGR